MFPFWVLVIFTVTLRCCKAALPARTHGPANFSDVYKLEEGNPKLVSTCDCSQLDKNDFDILKTNRPNIFPLLGKFCDGSNEQKTFAKNFFTRELFKLVIPQNLSPAKKTEAFMEFQKNGGKNCRAIRSLAVLYDSSFFSVILPKCFSRIESPFANLQIQDVSSKLMEMPPEVWQHLKDTQCANLPALLRDVDDHEGLYTALGKRTHSNIFVSMTSMNQFDVDTIRVLDEPAEVMKMVAPFKGMAYAKLQAVSTYIWAYEFFNPDVTYKGIDNSDGISIKELEEATKNPKFKTDFSVAIPKLSPQLLKNFSVSLIEAFKNSFTSTLLLKLNPAKLARVAVSQDILKEALLNPRFSRGYCAMFRNIEELYTFTGVTIDDCPLDCFSALLKPLKNRILAELVVDGNFNPVTFPPGFSKAYISSNLMQSISPNLMADPIMKLFCHDTPVEYLTAAQQKVVYSGCAAVLSYSKVAITSLHDNLIRKLTALQVSSMKTPFKGVKTRQLLLLNKSVWTNLPGSATDSVNGMDFKEFSEAVLSKKHGSKFIKRVVLSKFDDSFFAKFTLPVIEKFSFKFTDSQWNKLPISVVALLHPLPAGMLAALGTNAQFKANYCSMQSNLGTLPPGLNDSLCFNSSLNPFFGKLLDYFVVETADGFILDLSKFPPGFSLDQIWSRIFTQIPPDWFLQDAKIAPLCQGVPFDFLLPSQEDMLGPLCAKQLSMAEIQSIPSSASVKQASTYLVNSPHLLSTAPKEVAQTLIQSNPFICSSFSNVNAIPLEFFKFINLTCFNSISGSDISKFKTFEGFRSGGLALVDPSIMMKMDRPIAEAIKDALRYLTKEQMLQLPLIKAKSEEDEIYTGHACSILANSSFRDFLLDDSVPFKEIRSICYQRTGVDETPTDNSGRRILDSRLSKLYVSLIIAFIFIW